MTLSTDEFMRRFLLHVLPRGFQRLRQFGLLANRHRRYKLQRCRARLADQTAVAPVTLPSLSCLTPPPDLRRCPACQIGSLRPLVQLAPTNYFGHALPQPPPLTLDSS